MGIGDAFAQNHPVQFNVNWDEDLTPENIHVTAQLLDADLVLIGGPVSLNFNTIYSEWTATLVGANPLWVEFSWDVVEGVLFDPDSPEVRVVVGPVTIASTDAFEDDD